MKLTGKKVQGDVISLLKEGYIPSLISGGVYRNGYRPRDSKLEDAVVIFTAGLADEIQTGVVTVNIYVPDIDPFDNGVLVEDGQRCDILEKAAEEWVESLTAGRSNYRFELRQSIYTQGDDDIGQHFVVIKLGYEYFD